MKLGKTIPFLVCLAGLFLGSPVPANPYPPRALLEEFAMLPIETESGVISIGDLADSLAGQWFTDSESSWERFALVNATHLFLEIAIHPAASDQLRLFRLSSTLIERLGLDTSHRRFSYRELRKIHLFLQDHAEKVETVSAAFYPAEWAELISLGTKLEQYLRVRQIFRVARTSSDFSEDLLRTIADLPASLEARQNELEGLDFNASLAQRYQRIRVEWLSHTRPFPIIPFEDEQGGLQLLSFESTLLRFQKTGLLPPNTVLYAAFYDHYRERDYGNCLPLLSRIREHTPGLAGLSANERLLPDFAPSYWIFRLTTIFGLIVAFFLAWVFRQGSRRAGRLAILLSMVSLIFHFLWVISHTRSSLFLTFTHIGFGPSMALFIPILVCFRFRAIPLITATGLALFGAVLSFYLPSLGKSFLGEAEFPLFWMICLLIWKWGLWFGVAVSVWMLATHGALIWNFRQLEDPLIKQRAYLDSARIWCYPAAISILLSLMAAQALYHFTLGHLPIGRSALFAPLAMLLLISLFLQLRWVNRVHSSRLRQFLLSLFVFAVIALISLEKASHAFLFATEESGTLAWLLPVFILSAAAIAIWAFTPLLLRLGKQPFLWVKRLFHLLDPPENRKRTGKN